MVSVIGDKFESSTWPSMILKRDEIVVFYFYFILFFMERGKNRKKSMKKKQKKTNAPNTKQHIEKTLN
jgi:hypothetical protein